MNFTNLPQLVDMRGKLKSTGTYSKRTMTIQEWNAKQEEEFKAKTGITYDEWYVNQVKTTTPIEFIKEPKGLKLDLN
jgi:hypothetical protein